MRVAAITSGSKVPSARFRVRQYVRSLEALGVRVNEFVPFVNKYASWKDVAPSTPAPLRRIVAWTNSILKVGARLPGIVGSWGHDVCWLEREMMPGRLTFERILPHPLVFDIDDAVWLLSEDTARAIDGIARRADVVLAGNDFIATRLSRSASRVEVIPTGVDTGLFSPAPREPGRLRVGWVGTASNFSFLKDLEMALADFLVHHDAEFVVVADREPDLPSLGDRLVFERWSEAREVDNIRRFDIGVMPLRADEWSRGKCALKLLQYMACGVPAIATPIGVASGILKEGGSLAAESESDWSMALACLAGDSQRRSTIAKAGREFVIKGYSHEVIVPRLASVFRSLKS